MNVRKFIANWIGMRTTGRLEYYALPNRRESWGGPFNGQEHRCKMFLEILEACRPVAIVETGTYRGTTTEFMAKMADIPVFTVERNARAFGFCKERLRRLRRVRLEEGDSRVFIRALISSGRLPRGPVFFYLDAHGGEELPLAGELELIFGARSDAIVMIDDFQVPWEEGYAYDDYGRGKALTREYIAPVVESFGLVCFYPSVPARTETGARAGCVVLAANADFIWILGKLASIRHEQLAWTK
jgi:hypothetical protein